MTLTQRGPVLNRLILPALGIGVRTLTHGCSANSLYRQVFGGGTDEATAPPTSAKRDVYFDPS